MTTIPGKDAPLEQTIELFSDALKNIHIEVIEDNWHGYKFTDILNLNKINGEWKIVAKVYDKLSGE